ncbi:MAG: hypothetical protein WBQ94_05595 [Terracidiphilus sp.]
MNWRRGLLLAGIHLTIAAPMVLMIEARDEKAMRDAEERIMERAVEAAIKPPEAPKLAPDPANSEPPAPASPEQVEQAVSFSPCGMWVHYVPQVVVVQSADLPADFLAQWEEFCPPAWTLAGRLRRITMWPPTSSSMATQRKIDAGLGLLIALQWFLLGAFPLVRNPTWRRWWGEPGSFITVCAVLAGLLALIPAVDTIARLPALLAMLAWFCWVGLLMWVLLCGTWRLVVRKPAATG